MSDAAPCSDNPAADSPDSPAAPAATAPPAVARPLPPWLRPRWATLLLLALGLLVLLPRLGGFGLWDPHEVRLLEGAGEPISLAQLWVPVGSFKPRLPLLPVVWGTRLFGVSELGGRVPMVVLGLLTLLSMLGLGRALRRERAAVLAGFALLTMPVFFLSARQVSLTLVPVLAQLLAVTGGTLLCWPRRERLLASVVLGAVLLAAGLGLGLLSCGGLLGLVAPLGAVALTLTLCQGPVAGQLLASGLLGLALIMPSRFVLTLVHADAQLSHTLGLALLALGIGAAVLTRGRRGLWLTAAVFGAGLLPALPELKSGYSPWLAGLAHWPPSREVQVDSLLKPLGFQLLPWSALLPLALASVFSTYKAGAASADGAVAGAAEASDGRAAYAELLPVAWFAATYLLASLHGALVTEPAFPALGALALLTGQYLERLLHEPRPPSAPERIAAGLCVALLLIILGRDLFFAPELLLSGQLTETLRWPAPLSWVGQLLSSVGVGVGVVFGLGVWLAGSRRWVLGAALGLALGLALLTIHGLVPTVSHHVSYRGIYTKYQKLGGGALGIYGVQQSGSKIYGQSGQQLTSLLDVLKFLERGTEQDKRAFVIVGSGELAALDLAARERKQLYYVVDDTNSQFLLLSNRLAADEKDLNPLRRFISETPPPIAHAVSATFDDRIELIGYDAPAEVSRGDEIVIRLYYKVLTPLAGSYKVFLHFDGMGARFNGDHLPMDGRFPTSYWAKGHYITDEHRVPTSRLNQAAGYYQIFTGLWPGGDGARLKVTAGPHEPDHRVRLGIIKVK